jgi:hypothetical protein
VEDAVPSPLAIAQFARIVGRDAFLERVGLPAGASLPESLTDDQRARAREMAVGCAAAIARALLDEAMASDDIQDAAAAAAYLEERLAFLAPLLTEDTRDRVRRRYLAVADTWR